MSFRAILSALLLFSLSWPCVALQPLVTDDTGTQGKGGKQIEAAFLIERSRDSGLSDYAQTVPLVLTYGISDALDIGFGFSHQHNDPGGIDSHASGVSNSVLGAKYRFYENDVEKLSLAVKPEVLLPVSRSNEARGLGTGKTSYALSLLADRKTDFGTLIATLSAFRINYRDPLLDAAARNNQYLASVSALWNVGEQWQLGGEAGSYTQEDRALDSDSQFAQLAAIWSPNCDADLAFGIKRDFNTGSTVIWTTTLGLTYRFR